MSTPLTTQQAVDLYTTMRKIRRFEETVKAHIGKGIVGPAHLYIGEEAVATGVCSNLTHHDYVTSTHRGHGHTLAKGARVDRSLAELYGRATGYCKGKGGSMHLADFSVGMLGANGVVGGGFGVPAAEDAEPFVDDAGRLPEVTLFIVGGHGEVHGIKKRLRLVLNALEARG